MTWEGRNLKMVVSSAGSIFAYTYNDQGLRLSKLAYSYIYYYTWDSDTLVSQRWGNNLFIFLYDESGSPIGLKYRTNDMDEGAFYTFFFEKNLQGDIIAMYADDGFLLGTYTYDAWGHCTATMGTGLFEWEQTAFQYNPFRYRGYYYDTETGLYYLQRRYYDPNTGRFLNADNAAVISATPDQLTDKNLYAYCDNNPVMRTDDGGEFWHVAIAAAVGLAFELGTQLYESGGDWSQINVAKLGIATATAAISSACGPAIGAVISGAGEVLMELSDGTSDPKQLLSSFFTGTASSLVGSGVGEIARKVGGKIAVNVLSKKSPGEIKGVILSVIDVAGRDRNAVKNISWTLQQPQYKHLPSALLGENIPEFFSSVAGGIFDLLGGN